jgi:hypothetical protein
MNAPFPHITGGTLSDLVDFAIEENRWPHLQSTAKALYSLDLADTLADAKSLLQRYDRRETGNHDEAVPQADRGIRGCAVCRRGGRVCL